MKTEEKGGVGLHTIRLWVRKRDQNKKMAGGSFLLQGKGSEDDQNEIVIKEYKIQYVPKMGMWLMGNSSCFVALSTDFTLIHTEAETKNSLLVEDETAVGDDAVRMGLKWVKEGDTSTSWCKLSVSLYHSFVRFMTSRCVLDRWMAGKLHQGIPTPTKDNTTASTLSKLFCPKSSGRLKDKAPEKHCQGPCNRYLQILY